MPRRNVGQDPWSSLAAEVINRARDDFAGYIEDNIGSNTAKALIQYDAEQWIKHHPWCQFLLDSALPWDYDVPQYYLAHRERIRRSRHGRNYHGYICCEVSFTKEYPLPYLAKVLGLRKEALEQAAHTGRLQAIQQQVNQHQQYFTTIACIAEAITVGNISVRNRSNKERSGPLVKAAPLRRRR